MRRPKPQLTQQLLQGCPITLGLSESPSNPSGVGKRDHIFQFLSALRLNYHCRLLPLEGITQSPFTKLHQLSDRFTQQ